MENKGDFIKTPLFSNTVRFQYYLLSPDEAVFLDWLIFKQVNFNFKPFFYSQQRIEKETRIKRTRLESIIREFQSKHYIDVAVVPEAVSKLKTAHYSVNFDAIQECLMFIINGDNKEYYAEWDEYLECCKNKIKHTKMQADVDVEKLHADIVDLYNKRLKMYNKGKLYKKSTTTLPKGKKILKELGMACTEYGEVGLQHAFTAYADAYLKGEFRVKTNMLSFFLTNQSGTFSVINQWLEVFNSSYSHKKD